MAANNLITVIDKLSQENDSTDIALMVSTSSKAEVDYWDRERIVQSLIREINAQPKLAQEIAEAVERKIFASNLQTVTTSLIRELVDIELLSRGFQTLYREHTHLGLPAFDVEQIIFNANKENSNTTHNPESINLTLAESILKQFALSRVFSQDVAEAHLSGDIHLHDLGFITRPYTYMGDCLVNVRTISSHTEAEQLMSIKDLYDLVPFEEEAEEGVWVKHPRTVVQVLDKDGKWTRVYRLTKKSRKGKPMIFVRTSDGRQQVVTYDHPMICVNGIKQAKELKTGDVLFTEKTRRTKKRIRKLNLMQALIETAVGGWRYTVLTDIREDLEHVEHRINTGFSCFEHYEDKELSLTKKPWRQTPIQFDLTEDLGWLLGFYIAEGRQSENSIAFTTSGEGKERLIETLKRLNISYEQNKRDDRVVVNDTLLRDIFIKYWKVGNSARTKALPPQIMYYPDEFLRGVVAGIIDGDGSVDGCSIAVRLSSSKLINQLHSILEVLGFTPSARKPQGVGSVRYYNGRTIVQNYPVWGIAFSKREDISLPSFKYECANTAKRKSILDEPGKVHVTHCEIVDIPDAYIYDITTESHTFLCNGIYSHNCGGHSLEYIKKYGISLPNITSTSKPAKHPEVLIGHMVKMASTLQSHYAGAIGWEAVNMFFAPFLTGLTYERIKQLAQMIIYEFNQLAGARGSQVVFTDFNLYYGIPKHFKNTPAVGPGGKYMKKIDGEIVYVDNPDEECLTYSDFEKESNLFLKALFEVYYEGDATGKTFVFPKPLLHINEEFFITPGWEEFLDLACKVAAYQGITYFVFDRGGQVTVSQCCRLKLKLGEQDLEEAKTPEKMRFTALQNITLNLPRAAYMAAGDEQKLFTEIDRLFDLAVKAHLQKKKFLETLLSLGDTGPLAFFTAAKDSQPYLRMDRLTYLVGILGLNELVQYHLGIQLHESEEALKYGLKVISYINILCKKYSEKYCMKFVIEESPAESACYRLAKLDLKHYPEQASRVIKGFSDKEMIYYTNSIHLAADAPVDYIDRVVKQSKFHPLIEAGAIIHIWLGEHQPDHKAIKEFVIKTYNFTKAEQIAFSPEFTVCESCLSTTRGLYENCPKCGSEDIYGITRIVGYFSKITTWNKGKKGELRQRIRTRLDEAFKKVGGKPIEDQVFLQARLPEMPGS